jgi:hypothetical protein
LRDMAELRRLGEALALAQADEVIGLVDFHRKCRSPADPTANSPQY